MGTPGGAAGALLDYKSISVTQFIISGCPELDEIATFGREIVPLVRQAETGRTDRMSDMKSESCDDTVPQYGRAKRIREPTLLVGANSNPASRF